MSRATARRTKRKLTINNEKNRSPASALEAPGGIPPAAGAAAGFGFGAAAAGDEVFAVLFAMLACRNVCRSLPSVGKLSEVPRDAPDPSATWLVSTCQWTRRSARVIPLHLFVIPLTLVTMLDL